MWKYCGANYDLEDYLKGFLTLSSILPPPPATADDASITNHIIDVLSKIKSSMPNAAIIIAGDFNRLNVKQIINQFRLKQFVKFPTRGNRALDPY